MVADFVYVGRVLDDLDVDLRGNGIEGVSRLDYRQPIVAVKCNKKARAFPEDAKKTLDVIKVRVS